MRQIMGLSDPITPMAPPESMRSTGGLPVEEVIQFMVGLDIDFFRGERERAPVPGEATRATRAHTRGAPSIEQTTCWPGLPTALMC